MVSVCIPALVFLTPFSLSLATSQALLCLKTATYLVWILAFSLFPLQRTEESPFFIFNPREYSLRKCRLWSVCRGLQLTAPSTLTFLPFVLLRVPFVPETDRLLWLGKPLSWLSSCLQSAALCPVLCFPSPLALKGKFFNILPHRLCLESLPGPQQALSPRVHRAVYLRLLLSVALQPHFLSQPVPRALTICSSTVHTVSRRPLEKMSSSGSRILRNLISLSSITRLFKVRNFKTDLTFSLQICGNLRVCATSTPWLVFS